MTTLTVWKFDSTSGAQAAQERLLDLARQGVITVHDAATVTWEVGAKKPKTRELVPTTGAGALGGAFWGLLFGLIFFVPLLGAAIGAATGALAGSLTDVGIDDTFINKVARPGHAGHLGALPDVFRRRRRQAARRLRRGSCGARLHQPEQRPGGCAPRGLLRPRLTLTGHDVTA